jgi:hypothetical protein
VRDTDSTKDGGADGVVQAQESITSYESVLAMTQGASEVVKQYFGSRLIGAWQPATCSRCRRIDGSVNGFNSIRPIRLNLVLHRSR